MAEQDKGGAVAPRAPDRSASALAEVMEGAKALQALQAQAAQEAMRLPNPRLDMPEPGATVFLRDNGDGTMTAVDPNGEVLKADMKPEAANRFAASAGKDED